ncbi:hypothetical protein [Acaryochloris sp. IP29b_bin.137]|uniref:hypothetical protein n=1 Tax=Acaryochloris sp. IP29b_bin.137 TaxID=2969217 RepID=UPI002616803B|nr:hypothetical protein [Acaryochloris sp. IP29b_bin.137]
MKEVKERAQIAWMIFSYLFMPVTSTIFYYSTEENVTFTVEDAERVSYRKDSYSESSKYLIFTEDETFENSDSVAYLNSILLIYIVRLRKGKRIK